MAADNNKEYQNPALISSEQLARPKMMNKNKRTAATWNAGNEMKL